MRIGLIAVDSDYPNLTLMKVSAYHKTHGDHVNWYSPWERYDKVYMAKVFNFTEDYDEVINADDVVRGGTGYDIHSVLPDEMDMLQPDYSIYPQIDRRTAYGFLTRGCPNKCPWCVVPAKEGMIRPYMDVEQIAADGRTHLVLMDNNILASDYGLEQIEKIVHYGYHVDFNQALDARLVSDDIAALLAKVRWIKRIRFGCDSKAQISHCLNAITAIQKHGYKGEFFLYCILMDDMMEAYSRIECWKEFNGKVLPHAQPYRDPNNPRQVIPQWQKDMARWTDRKEIWRTCDFWEFEPRKGFICKEYLKEHYYEQDLQNPTASE